MVLKLDLDIVRINRNAEKRTCVLQNLFKKRNAKNEEPNLGISKIIAQSQGERVMEIGD